MFCMQFDEPQSCVAKMNFWLLIAACLIVVAYLKYRKSGRATSQSIDSRQGAHQPKPQRWRPSPAGPSKTISFRPIPHTLSGDLDDRVDALTGAKIKSRRGIHECSNCAVVYEEESYAVIIELNQSKCVACGVNVNDIPRGPPSPKRQHSPQIITLDNFGTHYGRVITFEGRVVTIRSSRRGTDYAVMFQNLPWTKGLKLVFFRRAVSRMGGAAYVQSLSGRRIKVRGLLINHAKFGPEIVVSDRNMILGVS
jgi:hypothetical protein